MARLLYGILNRPIETIGVISALLQWVYFLLGLGVWGYDSQSMKPGFYHDFHCDKL